MAELIHLSDRAIIKLTGKDVRDFLQGMVTNDMDTLNPEQSLFTALLSPQGKFLFDFFLYDLGDHFMLDCDTSQADDLVRRLTMYKMRADVTIEPQGDHLQVWVSDKTSDTIFKQWPDPRHKELGNRGFLHSSEILTEGPSKNQQTYYEKLMKLGIPNGIADMGSDKTLILEGNYGEINAISFTKGCYVGQENTARMMHRKKVRRRLIPVTTDADCQAGDLIYKGDKKVGEVRSAIANHAMAYLRVEDLAETLTLVGGTPIHVRVPDWLEKTLNL